MIENVGKDVDIVTNSQGGQQAEVSYALHLIDPNALDALYMDDPVISRLTEFMQTDVELVLIETIDIINGTLNGNSVPAACVIGKVLKEGAEKYAPNNWRLIPQEEHLNHALIHYIAFLDGNTEDDHLEHCMTRLMMAYATERSNGFEYTKPVTKVHEDR